MPHPPFRIQIIESRCNTKIIHPIYVHYIIMNSILRISLKFYQITQLGQKFGNSKNLVNVDNKNSINSVWLETNI